MRRFTRFSLSIALIAFASLVILPTVPVHAEKSEEQRIAELNKLIQENGYHWIAGTTGVSRLSPEEKKKLLVDDDLLMNFFRRLEGETQGVKISFRFVLGLVLMRKKLLIYDRMVKQDDGVELWQMHFRGSNQMHEVIDPKLDEDKIAEVSGQLTQILNGEL